MVMKKHIVYITFLFIFIKKINIQKTHRMKKKTKYQTNIFPTKSKDIVTSFYLSWKKTILEEIGWELRAR